MIIIVIVVITCYLETILELCWRSQKGDVVISGFFGFFKGYVQKVLLLVLFFITDGFIARSIAPTVSLDCGSRSEAQDRLLPLAFADLMAPKARGGGGSLLTRRHLESLQTPAATPRGSKRVHHGTSGQLSAPPPKASRLTKTAALAINAHYEQRLSRRGDSAVKRAESLSTLMAGKRASEEVPKALEVLNPQGRGLQSCRRRPKAWSSARVKSLAAKQKKAAARRSKHTARLRATVGESTIIETLGLGSQITTDYRSHLGSFWDFADRWGLQLKVAKHYDLALCDWADFEFLDGEGPYI